jgi:hypothetical protein
MSQNFEGVIRPFQLPDFAPPVRSPDAQYQPIRPVLISVGANGSAKTMGGSFDLTVTYYMINKPKEEKQQQ